MSEYEDLETQLRAWLDEDEMWAREASRVEDNPAPDKGIHWQWVSSDDETVELDTATMAYVDEGCSISLRSREYFPNQYVSPLPQFAISTAEEVPIAVGGHIVRHDPAAVLADIAGKLALLDWAFKNAEDIDGEWGCGHTVDEIRTGRCDGRGLEAAMQVLRCVAAGYVERDGFKDTWRIGG